MTCRERGVWSHLAVCARDAADSAGSALERRSAASRLLEDWRCRWSAHRYDARIEGAFAQRLELLQCAREEGRIGMSKQGVELGHAQPKAVAERVLWVARQRLERIPDTFHVAKRRGISEDAHHLERSDPESSKGRASRSASVERRAAAKGCCAAARRRDGRGGCCSRVRRTSGAAGRHGELCGRCEERLWSASAWRGRAAKKEKKETKKRKMIPPARRFPIPRHGVGMGSGCGRVQSVVT